MAVTYTQHQGSTYNTAITASASANAKGSYTQLVASLSGSVNGFFVIVSAVTTSNRSYLLDIATGGAGSETVIVANLPVQIGGDYHGGNFVVFVPLPISSGTRVAARCQSSTGSSQIFMSLLTVAGELSNLLTSAVASTYGATTGTSRGTSIDPGAVADTKGTYVQMTAATSTSNNLKWLIVLVGNQSNAAMSVATWALDIATGAAASETVVVPDLIFSSSTAFDAVIPGFYCLPVDIANGTRIAARAKCTITDATDRLVDLVLIGVEGVVTIGASTTASGGLVNGGLAR